MLLKAVDELMYENDVLDLPCTPDVGDYLQLRVFSCYLCIAWSVTNNQAFITLAITFQNNKIVRRSDASISPKHTSSAEVPNGSKN
jgi:hypothetical protein